ncbi:uncharacterized protein LOC124632234 isoform X2 [Helicoverpa zea]|uniref:uncharacterized protein LOC124632234 isoform X2 n=1 Tax=Helicoverpa zea TaxID=7113 RepID=UPI001F56D2C2|nr:uncharacterized protein LOC124632234 isoform X2 [Helicoverpa zea]
MSKDIQFFSGVDDISVDDFLFEFRTIAAINKWKENDFALLLGAYLQGPALAYYKYIYVDGIEYKTICDKLRAEFPDNVNYVEKFYNARQEQEEELLSYYYRLGGLQTKANIVDDNIFIKTYLKGLISKYKAILSSQLFATKSELRETLVQVRYLFGKEQNQIINLPVIPPRNDDRKFYDVGNKRNAPCSHVNTHNAFSVEKEAPPSKDVEMEQHDEEQHAEQPVELLAIGSEVEYKSGETGPNINVLIAQQEFRALVDTGASISCLSEAFISELNIKYTKNSSYEASSVSGAQLHVLGETYINFLIDSCLFRHKFLIIKNIRQNIILGRDFLSKNNCIIDFSKNNLILKTRFIAKFIKTDIVGKDRLVSNMLTDKGHHSDKNNDKMTCDIDNEIKKINYIYSRNKIKAKYNRNKVLRKRHKRVVSKSRKTSTSSKLYEHCR